MGEVDPSHSQFPAELQTTNSMEQILWSNERNSSIQPIVTEERIQFISHFYCEIPSAGYPIDTWL